MKNLLEFSSALQEGGLYSLAQQANQVEEFRKKVMPSGIDIEPNSLLGSVLKIQEYMEPLARMQKLLKF